MADPGSKKPRATYQDVLDAPENMIAEIINGDLRLSPRPRPRHTRATTMLGYALGGPFDVGEGGPGGWIFLKEPELHLGEDVVVPDLAGWRRSRLAAVPDEDAFLTVAPDWICEVLSPSTERMDRTEKLAIYAAAGVQHAWIVHPRWRTLEVMRLVDGKWGSLDVHVGEKRVRAEPFEALEWDLAMLWRDVPPPAPRGSRASEASGDFWAPSDY